MKSEWSKWDWKVKLVAIADEDNGYIGELARPGDLSRGDVFQHHRSQWKHAHQERDPGRCDRLTLLSTIDRHLHHPLAVADEKIAAIHDVR